MIKIEELKKDLDLGEVGEVITEYSDGYIDDIFGTIANEEVDIYNSDLMDWASEKISHIIAIEEAFEEFGTPNPFDFYELIKQGQNYFYYNELQRNRIDVLNYRIYHELEKNGIAEISEEQREELDLINFNLSLSAILDEVYSIFNIE